MAFVEKCNRAQLTSCRQLAPALDSFATIGRIRISELARRIGHERKSTGDDADLSWHNSQMEEFKVCGSTWFLFLR